MDSAIDVVNLAAAEMSAWCWCEWKSVGTNSLAIELKTDKDMEMERDRKGERERERLLEAWITCIDAVFLAWCRNARWDALIVLFVPNSWTSWWLSGRGYAGNGYNR